MTRPPMNREALEKMLADGVDNLMLRYSLGTLCFREKAFEQAARHLGRALEFDPAHSASWKFYARSLVQLGRTAEAQEAFNQGIAVAQQHGDMQAVKEMQVFRKRLEAG